MSLEKVACPICGGNSGKRLMVARDRIGHFEGEYALIDCAGCHLAYVNPRPDGPALAQAYSSPAAEIISRFNNQQVNKKGRFTRGYLKARRWILRVSRLRSIRPDSTILDVGCGNGAFLYYARRYRSFKALGIDIGKPFVDYARQDLGLDVYLGELADGHFPPSSIDVVRLWHVLEHLGKPLPLLTEIRRLLKTDGLFVLQVPCFDSVFAKLFRTHWIFHLIPWHVYQFTPDPLSKLLRKAGFEVLRVEGELMPLELTGSLFYCLGGNLLALMRRKVERPPRPAWSRVLIFIIFWAFFLTLGLPYLILEWALLSTLARFKRAGNLTVYCRKTAV